LTVTGGTIPANGVYLPAANTLEFAANSLAQYRIAPLGVFSWYDGAGGTRMTLNSNALAIGVTGVLGAGSLQFPVGTQIGCQSDNFVFGSNSKYDGGWKYVTAAKAALQYQIITGQHLWFNSAVGVAVNDPITFVQAMTLAVGGNLLIGTTTNNANGGVLQLKSGITFPATQVAATDVNTLDDYEEGTWTGTLKGSITDPTVAVTATGRYTKIGRYVFIDITFSNISNVGASGDISVTGLPFACNSSVNAFGVTSMNGMGTFAGGSPVSLIVAGGTTLSFSGNVSGLQNVNVTHNPGTGRYFNASISYSV